MREKRSWLFSLTESGTAVVRCQVSRVLLSSTFCCQLKPFLVLGWWLCNLSDPHVCMWVEMYGSLDTLRILFSENGLTNQGSCWRNVAASHASVIVNVSETCCVFFFSPLMEICPVWTCYIKACRRYELFWNWCVVWGEAWLLMKSFGMSEEKSVLWNVCWLSSSSPLFFSFFPRRLLISFFT